MKFKQLKQCNHNDILCVDFFDTLVTRKHSPNFSVLVWCRKIIEYFGLDLDVRTLYFLHKSIVEVCDRPYKKSIQELLKYLKIYYKYDINFDSFYEISKEYHYQIELNELKLNKSLIGFLNIIKPNVNKIVILSDFYFEKDFYLKALNNFNLNELFDEVYVSSEYNKTKKDGNFYLFLKDKYKNNNLIMIGDNFVDDYVSSTRNGFMAVHYTKIMNKFSKISRVFKDFKYDAQCIKRYKKIFNKNLSTGLISNYAFSLYDFCEKLYKYAIKNKINKLYFLSREGQFLLKLFEAYQKGKYKQVSCEYLYLSRFSSFLPSLYGKEINNKSFSNLTKTYNNLSLNDFLKNCKFNEDEIQRLNFKDLDKVIYNFTESAELKQLLSNDMFLTMLKNKIDESYSEFYDYFASKTGDNNQIYLVDVGWKGTMQDNLVDLFPKKNFIGLYLGLNSIKTINENKKIGLLWNVAENPYNVDFLHYEYILKADHGKVVDYKNKIPILEDDGDVSAYNNIVKYVQNDIFEKFEEII